MVQLLTIVPDDWSIKKTVKFFNVTMNTQLKWHENLERNRVFWQSQKGIQEKQRKKQRWKGNNFLKEMMWVAYALGRRIVCLLSLKMEERRKCKRDCCCQTWRRFTNILWQKTLLWKLDSLHLPYYDQSGVYLWDHLGHNICVLCMYVSPKCETNVWLYRQILGL